MHNYLKIFLIFYYLLCQGSLKAQELNVGISIGYNSISEEERIDRDEKSAGTFGAIFEFRPKNAIFSLNTEARILFHDSSVPVNFPFYFKFIFGKKFRLCPYVGAFIKTNSNYGGLAGVNGEFVFKNKWIGFLRYEYSKEFYKESVPSHFGLEQEGLTNRNSQWLGVGVKFNLL